jgi:hypothetical protein
MTDRNDEAMNVAYLALGRMIAGQCPVGFEAATLSMEIGDRTRLWIAATQPDGTETRMQPGDSAARDILESLRGIRAAMPREDGSLWQRCTVTLGAGGRFAIDVEY